MSAFVSNCHFTVYFGEISPKPRHRRWRAKEDPLSIDDMLPPASVLLIAGRGMTAPSMGPSSAGSRFSTNKRPTHQIKAKGNIFSASITPGLGFI